jgi:SAM-dependent methyltransferase
MTKTEGEDLVVPRQRDVQAHRDVASRSIDLAFMFSPSPRRVLDVGHGAAGLLRQAACQLPEAFEITGIDAAAAGRLPFGDASFDLVISASSFDRWADQGAGLAECRRVLEAGGLLVLTGPFSLALPASWVGPPGRATTTLRATRLLAAAGFRTIAWHRHGAPLVRSVTARAGRHRS